MPIEQLKKENKIDELIDNLRKCMIADMQAGKMILNANLRKRKTHYDLQKAREEVDAFKRDFC